MNTKCAHRSVNDQQTGLGKFGVNTKCEQRSVNDRQTSLGKCNKQK